MSKFSNRDIELLIKEQLTPDKREAVNHYINSEGLLSDYVKKAARSFYDIDSDYAKMLLGDEEEFDALLCNQDKGEFVSRIAKGGIAAFLGGTFNELSHTFNPAYATSSVKFSNNDERMDSIDDSLNAKDNLNSLLMAHVTIGEEGMNCKDPIYIQQPDDHSCALRSQQIVLRDFGVDIPFEDLEQFALEHNMYSEDGTLMYDIGDVMESAGVPVHKTTGNTVNDLMDELSKGHRIIVGVDADELWYNNTDEEQSHNARNDIMTHFLQNVFGIQGGNHALIVAGVDVDLDNPENVNVVLTDPGSGDLRVTYPISQFQDAWEDSGCFMVATDEPAPYQYDPETGKEIPSSFAIQEHLNQWVLDNSYQLSPDMINIPDNYAASYNSDNIAELRSIFGIDEEAIDNHEDNIHESMFSETAGSVGDDFSDHIVDEADTVNAYADDLSHFGEDLDSEESHYPESHEEENDDYIDSDDLSDDMLDIDNN